MSSANTFGTFLETLNTIGSPEASSSGVEADVLSIARVLMNEDGAEVRTLAAELNRLPKDLLAGVVAGRDKGLFEIDQTADEPIVKLTKFGRSFAG